MTPPTAKQKKKARDSALSPIRGFKTQKDFASWLDKNHDRSSGLWVRIAKKGSGIKSLTYAEALEAALCYGWIDGLKKPESEKAWLQRFVARRPRSLWSQINRDKALALIAAGRMKAAGHTEIERARKDGPRDGAYDSPSTATDPTTLPQ